MVENEQNPNFRIQLGKAFRDARKARKQTLSQVASSCDASLSNISKIEQGKSKSVGLSLLKGIADAIPVQLYVIVAAAEGADLGGVDALDADEQALIAAFRSSDPGGRETLLTVAASLTVR